MEQMDCKPYQPLSKARHEMELAYTSSSDESEDGRNMRKSYTSRETLPDYGQELRLNYNSHSRKRKAVGEPTQEMEFCETPALMRPGYQSELRAAPQFAYTMGSDVDTETEGGPSPDHALRLWMRDIKSEHSSCLSSRANSVLSLTDTEQERKSDGENGERIPSTAPACWKCHWIRESMSGISETVKQECK
ncbi:TEN1 protein, partial [Polyodon spathula]|nr:TEN1 protein [Polyodon spathula]